MDPDLCNGLIIPLHQSFGIISKFLESNNILGETQGAFRKDRRIEDQIFSLQGIASLYKSSRKPLYLAFLDLSRSNQSDSKSPNITLFSTFSYIFLSSLQHFPFIPFSHRNAKRPSRQTLSKALLSS
jgi:hypothetical protein